MSYRPRLPSLGFSRALRCAVLLAVCCASGASAAAAEPARKVPRAETLTRFGEMVRGTRHVFLAKAEYRDRTLRFTCIENLKPADASPAAGQIFEFKSNLGAKGADQAILLMDDLKSTGYRVWWLKDGKLAVDGSISLADLRSVLGGPR